ncbi:substrate-binding periplasmic protein [Chitinimonas sp. PSY-7]|uniref:transporter substrate-binding domain-containing protein n=1 Tax=Chitinimonas sp. PSY-7 TaxID=3459088 RepID=UPI00404014B4
MARYLVGKLILTCVISLWGQQQFAWGAGINCGPFNVALYEFGSLYYYDDDAKGHVGIDKDVIEELGNRTGCKFKPFLDSRVRIWTHLADGSLDMSVAGIPTPEREKFARFVIYFQACNYLIVRPELATQINSLDDFLSDSKLRLAVVRSFKHGKNFDQWIGKLREQGRVDEYPDADTVARIFSLGRADGFLSIPVVWGPLLKHYQLDGKVSILDLSPEDIVSYGLILSRKRIPKEAEAHIRKGMRAMRDDGTLERIFSKYLPADVVKRMIPSRQEPV